MLATRKRVARSHQERGCGSLWNSCFPCVQEVDDPKDSALCVQIRNAVMVHGGD